MSIFEDIDDFTIAKVTLTNHEALESIEQNFKSECFRKEGNSLEFIFDTSSVCSDQTARDLFCSILGLD